MLSKQKDRLPHHQHFFQETTALCPQMQLKYLVGMALYV